MLDPGNRALLTDELTPPRGFRLSHAVGTTFTLDLTAALSVPLAFTAAGMQEEPEPTSIMGALMSVSDRIDVFAQAGAWSISGQSDLVSLLETSIHPVAPAAGIFHPKIWLLEFTDGISLRHRMISSSRNLTFDRSWDALISLDGTPADPQDPDAPEPELPDTSRPLADLVGHMVERSRPRLPAARRRRLLDFAERLRRVSWDIGEHYSLAFHVLGLPGASPPDFSSNRTLVVSPFVTPEGLQQIAGTTRQVELISRAETLDALPAAPLPPRTSLDTFVMDGAAEDVEESSSETVPADPGDLTPTPLPTGLHAKIISCAANHRARLFLGSANATGPAWRQNVEVMVELEGRRHQLGPKALRDSLGPLLIPYALGEEPAPSDERQGLGALEHQMLRLAAVPLRLRVHGDGPYTVEVSREGGSVRPSGIRELRWHLLGREDLGGIGFPGDETAPVVLEDVELTDITAFLKLIAVAETGETRSTLVLAELEGDPEDRRQAVISRQLTDPSRLMELLMILLHTGGTGVLAPAPASRGGEASGSWSGLAFPGLLETLLQALAAESDGLAEARRLVDHLTRSEDAPELPPQFLALWESAWQAHQMHASGTGGVA